MTRMKPSPGVVIGAVALIVAMGGSAIAASTLIRSSDQIKKGAIQFSDLSKQAKKKLKGRRGPQGDDGPQGIQGPEGDPGADATALWALVDGDGVDEGTLIRGSGVSAVAKTGEGAYTVTFNQAVDTCSYVATPSRSLPDRTVVASNAGAPANDVRVETANVGAGPAFVNADANFSLAVFC